MITCGIGYSNILFGIFLVFSFYGEPNINFLGLCYFEKKYLPWLYLIAIYATVPNSSLLGHLAGILAALLIKFCGFYIFLPRYLWLHSFDNDNAHSLKSKVTYYEATESIGSDFDSYFFIATGKCIKRNYLKIKAKLTGGHYQEPRPNVTVCTQIEFSNFQPGKALMQ